MEAEELEKKKLKKTEEDTKTHLMNENTDNSSYMDNTRNDSEAQDGVLKYSIQWSNIKLL